MRPALPALVLLTLACAARGAVATPPSTDDRTTEPSSASTEPTTSAAQRYRVTTTVPEDSEHGPQLCLGGVAESDGDWDAIAGEESVRGTTWVQPVE